MASTVENINTNLIKKIDILKKLTDIYSQYDLSKIDNQEVDDHMDLLIDIESTYEFGSITILSNYYKKKTKGIDTIDTYNDFMRFVARENIIGNLKRIYKSCKKYHRRYDVEGVEELFENYEFTPVSMQYPDCKTDKCACGSSYSIESKTSEFICYSCGNTQKMYGIVFEDEQFFYQEGQRTKHGRYDPTKHCKFWVDRIQARENVDIPKKVISAIKRCIKRDNIWLDQITCPMIRTYLKSLKLTSYNDHVPYIRKLITGKEPKQLTDSELKLIFVYFSIVIQVYNQTKPDDKPNCPYHPFFIYKIIEHILQNDHARRKDIMSCIHLQSRETLIENDKIWKRICKEIKDFKYKPTDGG